MSSNIGSMRNVKIFVLYLLENINYPLDFSTINDIVMQTDYVMYLDFAEGFHEMVDMHLIDKFEEDGKELYLITDRGRVVARELKSDLLASVLDKALTQALRYLDFKKRGIKTKTMIEKRMDGKYDFTCKMLEKDQEIFSTTVTVDTLLRAERMRENFSSRSEGIYKATLALLAGNVNFLLD